MLRNFMAETISHSDEDRAMRQLVDRNNQVAVDAENLLALPPNASNAEVIDAVNKIINILKDRR